MFITLIKLSYNNVEFKANHKVGIPGKTGSAEIPHRTLTTSSPVKCFDGLGKIANKYLNAVVTLENMDTPEMKELFYPPLDKHLK